MRVFSFIDMKDTFWQVTLDVENSHLCTFNCACERYSFLRFSLAVNIASEVMLKRNTELFGDIPGVYVVYDDIIVAGKGENEHNERLCTLLKRTRKHHVRLKKNKMQYKVTDILICRSYNISGRFTT